MLHQVRQPFHAVAASPIAVSQCLAELDFDAEIDQMADFETGAWGQMAIFAD
jgi:hypothetical protein